MKQRICLLLFTITLCGCGMRQREEALNKREAAINEREQTLVLKEKSLQLKEEELMAQKAQMDSTVLVDTTYIINPALTGKWDVKMTCTETTCSGSAVGDVKNEQWEISYQGNKLIAKAMANDQLVRVYTGFYTGNTIELVEDVNSAIVPSLTKMIVRLRLKDDAKLEGEREIIREKNCKVVYALQAVKMDI